MHLPALEWDEETLDAFIRALDALHGGIRKCSVCGNLSDDDKCMICRDDTRNPNVICVVQTPEGMLLPWKNKEI